MRVATIFLTAGLALFANAQAPTTTDSSSAAASSAQAEMGRCITACGPSDVDCQFKCISVPSPNDKQANAAVDCVANCPRGKNTEADIIAFDACQTRCIQTNFLDNPEPKDGAGSNDDNKDDGDDKKDDSNDDNNDDGDDSNNKGEDATGTEGNNESKTDDNGSAPTKTGGAAALKGSLMGVVGLAAAVLAL